jgi:LPS-assembly protein
MLFGQSYQLFGQNSFAQGGSTNTGLDSGLDTKRSDYVARVSYQPNSTYKFTSRFRFDNEDKFIVKRTELEANAKFDRWNLGVLYGDYAAQPELGFLDRRQGVLGSGSVKLDANWVVLGAARYDINAGKFDQTRIGFGYVDDCLILALNYITNYTYSGNVSANHQIMLQLSLRTLGGTSVSQSVGGLGGL